MYQPSRLRCFVFCCDQSPTGCPCSCVVADKDSCCVRSRETCRTLGIGAASLLGAPDRLHHLLCYVFRSNLSPVPLANRTRLRHIKGGCCHRYFRSCSGGWTHPGLG